MTVAQVWMHNGFLQVKARRCRRRSATSSPSTSCWRPRLRRRLATACCASPCCARIIASRSTGRSTGWRRAEDAGAWCEHRRNGRWPAGRPPEFHRGAADDLNTPKRSPMLHELAQRQRANGALGRRAGRGGVAGLAPALGQHCCIDLDIEEEPSRSTEGKVERLIAERLAARKAKNLAESDRIRDELVAHGHHAHGQQGRHHDLGVKR